MRTSRAMKREPMSPQTAPTGAFSNLTMSTAGPIILITTAETLPKLNFENSPKLVEYIMNIGRKWVSPPYNVDGWRLDVAADLGFSNEYNHKFWKEFRKNVKEANPDAIILAEHYGEARSWLQGDEWDTVMNYDAFMEPLTWFLTGMEKHSDEFRGNLLGNHESFMGAMSHHMSSFMAPSLERAFSAP